MRLVNTSFLLVLLLLFITGCASIVSRSNWPFSVVTEPEGMKVSITNKNGREVYKGTTPATMFLKSGSGFFGKESYTVTLSKEGYETKKINVECKLNGWYFGNLLLGGVLGMLIVDPATGAMYKLADEGITETMTPSNASSTSLRIIEKDQVPENLVSKLVRID